MDETMPDAQPLTKRFLSSLAQFMEHEHQPVGEGDISSQVRGAIEKTQPESEGGPKERSGSITAEVDSKA